VSQGVTKTKVSRYANIIGNLAKGIGYFEKLSKHRAILPLYDLEPAYAHTAFIAPNATLVGEVQVADFANIWHNVVIRGDINIVRIGEYTNIGDHTVVHTANSLPTGIPAGVYIGPHVTIQSHCSLYSCIIEDEVFIGANSVILEGSRVERGAVIVPNSVVPPGRLIPAKQVWGGNPVEYIRDVEESEMFANYTLSYNTRDLGALYLEHFTPWSYNYLQKETTRDDVELNPIDTLATSNVSESPISKYYLA
jgi:carbonic anhydrase/acetyltransferase-like protein (isoleucine patch superfamily)